MSEIERLKSTPSVSGSGWWVDDDTDEFDEEEDEQCPYCDYNPSIHGYTSHYHCGRCGEETGMMGHYREVDTWDGRMNIKWKGFTCDVNNERGAEWPEDDEDVF